MEPNSPGTRKGRGRFPAHEEEHLCLPTGSVGSILGKATSTTDYWNTVKQTNKQTNMEPTYNKEDAGGRQFFEFFCWRRRSLVRADQMERPER